MGDSRRDMQNLALDGSLDRPLRWLGVLGAIPFAITVGVLAFVALRMPQSAAPPLGLLVLIPGLVLAAHLLLVRRIGRVGVRVSADALIVDAGLSTRRIPLADLRRHGLRVVDLRERTDLQPWLRTMGTGLPGLSAGWFRLRNRERALCLLLQRERVCYLRSDADNVSLLLSLREPERLRALLAR